MSSALNMSSRSSIRTSGKLNNAHRNARSLLPARPRLTPRPAMALAEVKTVVELTSMTLSSFLESHSTTLTVIDFYTTWCGPCKLVAPEVERMSQEFGDVAFAKFDCGAKDNQTFAVNLGIKALPTFQLYRGSEKVAEMTGAKAEQLRRLVASKQLTA